jgi:hypothetical protein
MIEIKAFSELGNLDAISQFKIVRTNEFPAKFENWYTVLDTCGGFPNVRLVNNDLRLHCGQSLGGPYAEFCIQLYMSDSVNVDDSILPTISKLADIINSKVDRFIKNSGLPSKPSEWEKSCGVNVKQLRYLTKNLGEVVTIADIWVTTMGGFYDNLLRSSLVV